MTEYSDDRLSQIIEKLEVIKSDILYYGTSELDDTYDTINQVIGDLSTIDTWFTSNTLEDAQSFVIG